MSLGMNVHQLLRVHMTRRADGKVIQRKALIDQLAGAVHPTGGGSGGGNETPLPINADAIETQQAMLHTAQQEEAERSGLIGDLTVILKRWSLEERAEWVAHLEHVTLEFIDQITQIVEPVPARRPIRKPCPACGTTWILNGNGDRKVALTAGVWDDTGALRPTDEWDISCADCEALWHASDPAFAALISTLQEAA